MLVRGLTHLRPDSIMFDDIDMAARVAEITDNDIPLFPRPIVTENNRLVGGKDALAQMVKLSPGPLAGVTCVVVELTSEEEEALAKLDEQDALTKREASWQLLDMCMESVRETHPDLRESGSGGRSYSQRGIARDWVGSLLKLEPSSVKKYDLDNLKGAPKAPIETWGLENSSLVKRAVAANAGVKKIRQALSLLESSGHTWIKIETTLGDLKEVSRDTVVAVCPACKGWRDHRHACQECFAYGLVTQKKLDVLTGQYPELKSTDPYYLLVDGELVLMREA